MKIIKITQKNNSNDWIKQGFVVAKTIEAINEIFKPFFSGTGVSNIQSFRIIVDKIKHIPLEELQNKTVLGVLKEYYLEVIKKYTLIYLDYLFYDEIYPESLKKDPYILKEIKKVVLKSYNEYAYKSYELNNKIFKMLKRFKNDDFIMSILYKKMYNKMGQENKDLMKIIEEIKIEKERSKKIHRILEFYSLTHENPSAYEMDIITKDLGQKNNGEINNYIDKYVVKWGK
jgi:hypothetical protein